MIEDFDEVFAQKPGLRRVNRAKLVDADLLVDLIPRGGSFPGGPVIGVRADTPVDGSFITFGMHSFNGCTMLFFDVFSDDEYFCSVASANDPSVLAAMKVWLKAGIAPVWKRRQDGSNDFSLKPFSLDEDKAATLTCYRGEHYLERFFTSFTALREPNAIEEVVAARHGRCFPKVHIGLLVTEHTNPSQMQVHRRFRRRIG